MSNNNATSFGDNNNNNNNNNGGVVLTEASFNAFSASMQTNVVIAIIVLTLFSYLRFKFAHVYAPRWTHRVTGNNHLSDPPPGFCGWITMILTTTDEDIFLKAGIDALALSRIFDLGMQLFGLVALFNIPCLMYAFGKWSIIEVTNDENIYLWFFALSVYLCSFLTYFLLYTHYKSFVNSRHRYLKALERNASRDIGVHGRTIMIENIPEEYRTDEALKEYFEFLFPGGVVDSACVARDPLKLPELLSKREKIAENLEAAYVSFHFKFVRPKHRVLSDENEENSDDDNNDDDDIYEDIDEGREKKSVSAKANNNNNKNNNNNNKKTKSHENPMLKVGAKVGNIAAKLPGGLIGTTVDSIEYYEKALKKINRNVQREIEKNDYPPVVRGIGFVTFQDSAAANTAKQLFLNKDPHTFIVSSAPEPRDIFWENVKQKPLIKRLSIIPFRSLLQTAGSFSLVTFWSIPVAAVQALTKLEKLEAYVGFKLDDTERAFLSGILPTIILAALMYVLPVLIEKIVKFGGVLTFSQLDKAVSLRFLAFQVKDVLLVSTLSGALVETVQTMITQPKEIPGLLASSLPNLYFFYVSYVMLLAFAFYPSQLLQIGTVVKQLIAVKRAKGNERLRRMALKPTPPAQGIPRTYSSALLVFVITFVFSSIAPLILPFSLIFFIFGWGVVRYMSMYVWEPKYESGGIMWLNIVDAVIYGLIMYQCTFIGLFGLKEGFGQAAAVTILPFVSYMWKRYLTSWFTRPFDTLSLAEIRQPEGIRTVDSMMMHGRGSNIMKQRRLLICSPDYAFAVSPTAKRPLPFDLPTAKFFMHPAFLKARHHVIVNKEKVVGPLNMKAGERFNDGPTTLQVPKKFKTAAIGISIGDGTTGHSIDSAGIKAAKNERQKLRKIPMKSKIVVIIFMFSVLAICGNFVFKVLFPPSRI